MQQRSFGSDDGAATSVSGSFIVTYPRCYTTRQYNKTELYVCKIITMWTESLKQLCFYIVCIILPNTTNGITVSRHPLGLLYISSRTFSNG